MGRPSPASLRGATIRIAIVLLVTAATTGCSLGRPADPAQPVRPEPAAAERLAQSETDPPTDGAQHYLVLHLAERRLYLIDDDPQTPVESFPIAVGRDGSETPTGRFHVEEMLEDPDFLVIDKQDRSRVLRRIPPGPQNPLGKRWIGFTHGEGWTLGIHGTPRPELLGQAVSNGCVRMHNADVVRVYDRIRLGTPVLVVP